MACFAVPAVEAIVVTAAALIVKSKERKTEPETFTYDAGDGKLEQRHKVSFSRKLNWLASLLWGGVALLAFEHIWHGEITAWFPFLTAASSPEGMAVMLNEMATVGTAMSVAVTLVWVGMIAVCSSIEKKAYKSSLKQASQGNA